MNRRRSTTHQQRKINQERCGSCNRLFSTAGGGLTRHEKRCRLQQEEARRAEEERLHIQLQLQAQASQNVDSDIREAVDEQSIVVDIQDDIELNMAHESGSETSIMVEDSEVRELADEGRLENDSYILITPHPRSGIEPFTLGNEKPIEPEDYDYDPSIPPYAPFCSINDFHFAKNNTLKGDSDQDINTLLKCLCDGTYASGSHISFQNAQEMRKAVDRAASIYTEFKPMEFEVPLQVGRSGTEMRKYTVWVKDGMEWVRSVIRDPSLAPHFTWHAYKKEFVLNGVAEQVYDDPLSGTAAWDCESKLTDDQVQLPLMFYSDKSNAARFSKTMDIYPALVRIANLPSHIRNRNSHHGGNTMIGLLPKVEPNAKDRHNQHWANHSREVHHRAWAHILKTFITASESGFTMKCGDSIVRTIIPHVSIISNDLEEAYKTALTRGNNSLFPCPRCLVPRDFLSDLHGTWELRTNEAAMKRYQEAVAMREAGRAKDADDYLQCEGLCEVENAWWLFRRTNVYQALSYDMLHYIDLGTWGDHLLPVLITELGVDGVATLDERAARVPAFPKLKTFTSASQHTFSSTTYSDGNTFFSMLQQVLPLVYDLIDQCRYPLLRMIRLLADITFHARMTMSTESRIRDGEDYLRELGDHLVTCISLFPNKNWDFPKMHQLLHMFWDIRNKGNVSNLSCNIGEGFHQGLIMAYNRSNKKNATSQILRNENHVAAILRIQWIIDQDNERKAKKAEEASEDALMDQANDSILASDMAVELTRNLPPDVAYVPVLSKANRIPTNAQQVDDNEGFYPDHTLPNIFAGFARDLSQFIYDEASQRPEGLVGPIEILNPSDIKITVYRRTDVTFTSLDSYYEQRSIIQCCPQFFSRTRFDTVLINTPGSARPARLHLIFEVTAYGRQWQVARVCYFTALPRQDVDNVINMQRYQEEKYGDFIFLGAIIRSCYMTPAFGNPGEFFLNPFIAGDTDLYLRCMTINPV